MSNDFLTRLYMTVSDGDSDPAEGFRLSELYETFEDVGDAEGQLLDVLDLDRETGDRFLSALNTFREACEKQGFINGFKMGMKLGGEIRGEEAW